MPLKAEDAKQAEAYQWNALRAQYPLVADMLQAAVKRIRKLEILCGKQQKAIRTLERQVQSEFAEYKRKEHERGRGGNG